MSVYECGCALWLSPIFAFVDFNQSNGAANVILILLLRCVQQLLRKDSFFVKSVDFFFNIKYSSTSVGSFDSSFPSISGTFHSGMLVCVSVFKR